MNEQPRKPRFIMPEFFSDEEEIKEEVKPDIKQTVEVEEKIIKTKAIVISTGASAKLLGLESERSGYNAGK
jgi:thioredoxin reductase